MEIRVDPHTLERAGERGASEYEIRDVINTGAPVPARQGRQARAKVYEFHQLRHDKLYDQKRIEVIYTVELDIAVTVTVYVFYGRWEEQHADSI